MILEWCPSYITADLKGLVLMMARMENSVYDVLLSKIKSF